MSEPNRFPGKCYRCGEPIEAGAGLFHCDRMPGLRWPEGKFQRNWSLVEHIECQAKFAGTNVHYLWSPHHESA